MGSIAATESSLAPSKYLCLTILGYRKPGMSEEAYRKHMHTVSAPMTKDLMVKYGVKRWTMVSHVYHKEFLWKTDLYRLTTQCKPAIS